MQVVTQAMVWEMLSIVVDVYDGIKSEMEAEMPTCVDREDVRYLLLDVARRRAGIDPQAVEDDRVVEDAMDLLHFYLDLGWMTRTIRDTMFLVR